MAPLPDRPRLAGAEADIPDVQFSPECALALDDFLADLGALLERHHRKSGLATFLAEITLRFPAENIRAELAMTLRNCEADPALLRRVQATLADKVGRPHRHLDIKAEPAP